MTDKQHIIILRIMRRKNWEDFTIYGSPEDTVLDLLEQLRIKREPELLYRHSCHHGSCGTCGMIINGTEALACVTRVENLISPEEEKPVITLEPLKGLRVIGDLAVEPSALFEELPDPADYLRAGENQKGLLKDTPPFVRFEDCIECGCCVSVCPVTNDFRGPAALAALNRERINHPDKGEIILKEAAESRGVPACEKAFFCSRVCPSGVAPGRQIHELRSIMKEKSL